MREQNRKNGRKSSGRKHGGSHLKRAGKRRIAPKRVPAPPPLPEIAYRIEAPLIPAPPVEAPRFEASPIAASLPPIEKSWETETLDETAPVRPVVSRGRLAVIAFVVAAMCAVALLRACEPKETPVEHDAAEPGSCSDDASMCVARA